jgi:hypothetical protein
MKAIYKKQTTYERIHTYNDQVEENTRLLSYMETDDRGNLVLDRSFNPDDGSMNTIRRQFDTEDRVTEEVFMDGEEEEIYETRHYFYTDGERVERCEIRYLEDFVTEQYHYDENGKLTKKEIVYEDGSSYVETECRWEGNLLQEEKEYSDTDELQSRKAYSYDDQGRVTKLVLYEPEPDSSITNKTTEVLTYGPHGVETQETYNISDQLVVRRRFTYDAQGRREAVTIESASSFFKHLYGYDENGNCILDRMLNREDLVLNEKHTTFDEKGQEIRIDVYSRNIVDATDELLLIESYTTEYQDI